MSAPLFSDCSARKISTGADEKNSAFPACRERPVPERVSRTIDLRTAKHIFKDVMTGKKKISGKRKQQTIPAKRTHRRSGLFELQPVGIIRSTLKNRSEAPRQASEGAPDAWVEIYDFALEALDGVNAGDVLIVLTSLHQAHREVIKVHPRSDPQRRLTGVLATRSPDRPNPIGLHRVTVRQIEKNRLLVGPIEAIDGTPVADIKPALQCSPRQ